VQHFDRQRTKIVQAREFHFSAFEHFLNSGHQGDPNAVTELNPIESKIDNLLQHVGAVVWRPEFQQVENAITSD